MLARCTVTRAVFSRTHIQLLAILPSDTESWLVHIFPHDEVNNHDEQEWRRDALCLARELIGSH